SPFTSRAHAEPARCAPVMPIVCPRDVPGQPLRRGPDRNESPAGNAPATRTRIGTPPARFQRSRAIRRCGPAPGAARVDIPRDRVVSWSRYRHDARDSPKEHHAMAVTRPDEQTQVTFVRDGERYSTTVARGQI